MENQEQDCEIITIIAGDSDVDFNEDDDAFFSSSPPIYKSREAIPRKSKSHRKGSRRMYAATAAVCWKKRKNCFKFETNYSTRRRVRNRLLRKLAHILNEFVIRVGQQAVVVVATPEKSGFDVFGAEPLEDIVRETKDFVIEKLKDSQSHQAPPAFQNDSLLFYLPPLALNGVPTSINNMSQTQLRSFIPLMLKHSTGRGKPGWGKACQRPPWWPNDLPWANIRTDARSEAAKRKHTWTEVLRQIVVNCYKYHGRQDLLIESDEKFNAYEDDTTLEAGPIADEEELVNAIKSITNDISLSDVDLEYLINPNFDTDATVKEESSFVIELHQGEDVTLAALEAMGQTEYLHH